jgi:hypothetical protein
MDKVKIEKKLTKRYGPVVLWWDDVVELFEAVRASAKDIEISTENYKFSTLEAAKEHFGETPQHVLKITASSPYVSVDGDKIGISVYVGSGPASAGLFLELDQVLSKRQRKPKWMYSNWTMLPPLALGPVQYAFSGVGLRLGLLGLQLAFFVWFLRAAFIGMKRGTVVYSRRRSESKGFVSRNKDQLALMIISALVGGAVAIGGAKVKEMYFPTTPTASESPK